LNEDSYKYKFNEKIHVEEHKIDRDDKGNIRNERVRQATKKMNMAELERIRNEEERRKLMLINIEKLKQQNPNSFTKEALQKDFEKGFDLIYKFLNRKIIKDYPFPIDTHKIFVNLNKIPKGREIPQIDYFLGQLYNNIETLKLMSYEMKLNGLTRVLMPIQANTEYVAVLKKIYDIHNIIDRILGDKLLYDQYLFIYDMIKFIHDSQIKEDLEVYKNQKFMEFNVPKYIFYMSMVKSADILLKFQKNSRIGGGHFTLDQYYQPLKHEIDSSNNMVLNAYEVNEHLEKGISGNYKEVEKIFWDEVQKFGRFWLMEGYFPPQDRDQWITAIDNLSNINKLVQEDIRDMILYGNDDKYRNANEDSSNINNNNKNYNSNNNIYLNTDNSQSESSILGLREKKKTKHGAGTSKHHSKRNNSRHGTKKHSSLRRPSQVSLHRKDSQDSTDKYLSSLPHNKNGLRPPFVWNFPIQRIEEIRDKFMRNREALEEVQRKKDMQNNKKMQKPKLDIVFKDEKKKNEIRKVNAYKFYHDGRIERFIDLFNQLYKNSMEYSKSKGNIWEYTYCKVLQVFGIEYAYKVPKGEEKIVEEIKKKEEEENKEESKNEEKTNRDISNEGDSNIQDTLKSMETEQDKGEEKIEEKIEDGSLKN
jgi:hypothetical protein